MPLLYMFPYSSKIAIERHIQMPGSLCFQLLSSCVYLFLRQNRSRRARAIRCYAMIRPIRDCEGRAGSILRKRSGSGDTSTPFRSHCIPSMRSEGRYTSIFRSADNEKRPLLPLLTEAAEDGLPLLAGSGIAAAGGGSRSHALSQLCSRDWRRLSQLCIGFLAG